MIKYKLLKINHTIQYQYLPQTQNKTNNNKKSIIPSPTPYILLISQWKYIFFSISKILSDPKIGSYSYCFKFFFFYLFLFVLVDLLNQPILSYFLHPIFLLLFLPLFL